MNWKRNTRTLFPGLDLVLVFFLCACFESAETTKEPSFLSEKFKEYQLGSSVVFPVSGNVYPLGYYFVLLHIGTPPKLFDLDIDTGSDLTWVQCDAPCTGCTKPRTHQYKPNSNTLPCSHIICSTLDLPQSRPCADPEDQCDYEIGYADYASSIGALVIDEFPLRLANGSMLHPRLTFGCGYDQQHPGPHPPPPTAGVLGLGRGKVSISGQLNSLGITKNVIMHCLSHKGGGFLSIGDGLVPSAGVSWTSLSHTSLNKNYMVGPAELLYNSKSTGVKRLDLVFDSGSSYTYFNKKAYQMILHLINKDLDGKSLTNTNEDKSLSVCWKGGKPIESVHEVNKYFKTLTLQFGSQKNGQFFQIPPESYLIITKYGNVCLGILNGTEVGLDSYNIIGDNFFQGMMVIYDNEKQRIGWASTNCNRLPKVDREYERDFSQPDSANTGFLEELFHASQSSQHNEEL